ncbi:ANTAR domain-containing protein [Antrihabitans stalactiti]|uniref:ANTAR domain-containing protein n=1 Tax=Antrihabitans stalactiti TaxID=2584121 RepID=UPI00146CFDB3
MDTHHPVADRRHADARMLDTAEGVLVALRRCSIDEAFIELVHVAKRHHVPTLAVARALVEHAENGIDSSPDTDSETDGTGPADIARHEWGHLFPGPLRHEPAHNR